MVYCIRINPKREEDTGLAGIPITLEIAAVTDIGRTRTSNQDNFYVNGCYIDHYNVTAERFETVDTQKTHILAVCDGMGGLAEGDVAAMIGVSTLDEMSDSLTEADSADRASFATRRVIDKANRRVLKRSRTIGESMGSTFAMLVVSSKYLYACNLGDSEIYLKTQYGLERLSKPQTVAQELVDSGAISESQASRSYVRNQLSKYLGMKNLKGIGPNECSLYIRNGDILLICSDGVSDTLANHSIYACLSPNRPVREIADTIIEKAIRKGSGDNLTVVIARVLDDGREARLRRLLAIALGITAGIVALTALLFAIF